jgi:predicted DNA-binding ribbon-helix-helix protein
MISGRSRIPPTCADMDRQSEERRCVELDGRTACVSLENDFWDCIEQIAMQRGTTLDHLVAQVVGDTAKDDLSAMLRVFVLTHFRQRFGLLASEVPAPSVAEDGVLYRMTEKRQIH